MTKVKNRGPATLRKAPRDADVPESASIRLKNVTITNFAQSRNNNCLLVGIVNGREVPNGWECEAGIFTNLSTVPVNIPRSR